MSRRLFQLQYAEDHYQVQSLHIDCSDKYRKSDIESKGKLYNKSGHVEQ